MKGLERWSERATTPAEARAAGALAALRAEPDRDEAAMARLQYRIAAAARPQRRRVWRWSPAVVALLVLGLAGAAAATIGVVVSRRAPVVIEPLAGAPAEEKRRKPRRRGPVIVTQEDAAAVGPPAPPVVETPPVEPPRPAPPKPAPAAPPPRSADGEEVRLFSEALRAWRAGDAKGALGFIEDYENLYPGGHFTPETILVKVDAMQALGRSDEALEFLRYKSLAKLPRATELEVIRGELSARAGRCEEAVIDLDQVLRREPGERLGARALYARASCRARLGDETGAETDLRLYLMRYPNGPHVTAVRRALAR